MDGICLDYGHKHTCKAKGEQNLLPYSANKKKQLEGLKLITTICFQRVFVYSNICHRKQQVSAKHANNENYFVRYDGCKKRASLSVCVIRRNYCSSKEKDNQNITSNFLLGERRTSEKSMR